MNYVVSVPLDPELAAFIGKKGSENSITFYNRKVEDSVIAGLAPASQDKFYAVAESMLISSQIIISTAVLDKTFGEVLLAASLLDRHVILTDDNNIDQYLKGIALKDFEIVPRGQVLDKILSFKPKYEMAGNVRVDIDKSFPVKGLGTIALGIVTKGTLKQHQELHHSSGKKALVRSMQSQDVDITEAPPGTRIGIALKNVEHDEIEKGDLLTTENLGKKDRIKVKIMMNKVSPEAIEVGKRYNIASNFSYSLGLVEEVTGNELVLKLDRNTAVVQGDQFLLLRDKIPRIFASGTVL